MKSQFGDKDPRTNGWRRGTGTLDIFILCPLIDAVEITLKRFGVMVRRF